MIELSWINFVVLHRCEHTISVQNLNQKFLVVGEIYCKKTLRLNFLTHPVHTVLSVTLHRMQASVKLIWVQSAKSSDVVIGLCRWSLVVLKDKISVFVPGLALRLQSLLTSPCFSPYNISNSDSPSFMSGTSSIGSSVTNLIVHYSLNLLFLFCKSFPQ